MSNLPNMTYDDLMHVSTQYDSMYFHQNCDKAARFALGSSIELLDNLMNDKVDNGFAIIRPPGHHAMHDEPNGYCYFNNAAVVAKTAIEKYNLNRIIIVDWDGKCQKFSLKFKKKFKLSSSWPRRSISIL